MIFLWGTSLVDAILNLLLIIVQDTFQNQLKLSIIVCFWDFIGDILPITEYNTYNCALNIHLALIVII